MLKHSPGPWRVEEIDDEFGIFKILPKGSMLVNAHVFSGEEHGHTAQERADADLIAAAPELLEALKVAAKLIPQARFWSCDDDYEPRAELRQIEAAIAKAEGRKPC